MPASELATKPLWLQILTAMFAAPAALSFLAQLDSRLSFEPILEKVVRNFEVINAKLWEEALKSVNVDIDYPPLLLTFFLVFGLPSVLYSIRLLLALWTNRNETLQRDTDTAVCTVFSLLKPPYEQRHVWAAISVTTAIASLIVFSLEEFAASTLITLAFVTAYVTISKGGWRESTFIDRKAKVFIRFFAVVPLALLSLYLVASNIWFGAFVISMTTSADSTAALYVFSFTLMMGMIVPLIFPSKRVAMIGLWILGVVIIDLGAAGLDWLGSIIDAAIEGKA